MNSAIILFEDTKMTYFEPWIRTVYCPFCNYPATLKPTKTRHLMLRCDFCKGLVFGNGQISQQRLASLPDYDPRQPHSS